MKTYTFFKTFSLRWAPSSATINAHAQRSHFFLFHRTPDRPSNDDNKPFIVQHTREVEVFKQKIDFERIKRLGMAKSTRQYMNDVRGEQIKKNNTSFRWQIALK